MLVIELLLIFVISYLIGSINMAIIISKFSGKGDIREKGSKNAGTTNVLRVLGKGPALAVFAWDVLKGVLAIGIARGISYLCGFGPEEFTLAYTYGLMVATFGVVLGHSFPIYFGFRGGKGVATSLGCILAIEPQIGLVCLVTGISMVALFNMVSVGSIISAILYPILVFFMGGHFDDNIPSSGKVKMVYFCFALVMAFVVVFRHKTNITRIRNGTENRLFKSKEEKIEESIETEKENSQVNKIEKEDEDKNSEEIDIKFEPKKEEAKDEK